jgi:PAS domain S-box-containing protein
VESERFASGQAALLDGVMALRSCAVFELDGEGTVRACNAGVETIFGYAPGELHGKSVSRLFSNADVERGAERTAVARALVCGSEYMSCALVAKDGARFRGNLILERVSGEGEVPRILMLVRDVTEAYQTQRRLHEAQETALRAQRMDAVGTLTLGLSHDFNNLLSVISNSLEMLAARRSGDESARRILDIAQRAVERGTRLTRQMLAFGRGQTLAPQTSDINEILQGSLELYRRVCGTTIQLQTGLMPGLPPVSVDVGQLEAALLNLLSNSRDAMQGAGKVVLETHLQTMVLPGGNGKEAAFVCVTVGDSGPGIRPDMQQSAFEPFVTTKGAGDGSGLGLSQVYGFAAQSGGIATIGSSALGGAAVSLFFPILAEA